MGGKTVKSGYCFPAIHFKSNSSLKLIRDKFFTDRHFPPYDYLLISVAFVVLCRVVCLWVAANFMPRYAKYFVAETKIPPKNTQIQNKMTGFSSKQLLPNFYKSFSCIKQTRTVNMH